MSKLTVKEFLDLVHRSRLLEASELSEAVADMSAEGMPTEGKQIAARLVAAGKLTRWQAKHLLAGKTRGFELGGYRLLDHLGTGGMSSVFLARHPLLERLVALKVLPASRSSDQAFLTRFLFEAKATSRLSHPNVVRVFDLAEERGTHFIVLEYVAGTDLRDLVRAQGPLPLAKAASYIAQAAAGLQHAHERGLIHRDVKPANLIVNKVDQVKILDLGLARADTGAAATTALDEATTMMGTADYLAPEQARSAHTIDHRADIYSLGCTFYYVLCGQAPFASGTVAERLERHQNERPPDVRAQREDCPHALADVCMTMLAKRPEDRFASAGMIAYRLGSWLHAQGLTVAASISTEEATPTPVVRAPRPAKPASPVVRRRSHRATIWYLLGVLMLICLGLLGAFLSRDLF